MQTSAAARIPVEIWMKIAVILRDQLPCPHRLTVAFDKHCPRIDCSDPDETRLLALSATCRFLHAVISTRLYESLLLGYPHPHRDDLNRELRDYALMDKPHLLSTTRHLRLSWPIDQPRWPIDHFSVQHLANVTGLRSLTLKTVPITPIAIQLLLAADNLEELVLQGCMRKSGLERDWSHGHFGRRLKELVLCGDKANEGGGEEGAGYPPRYLQLIVPGLVKLVSNSKQLEDIVPALKNDTLSLHQLTHLEIILRERSAWTILQVLPFCPNVETLGIDDINSNVIDHFPLDIVPRLRHCRGALAFVGALLGRPNIDSLHMTAHSRPIEDFPLGFPTLKTLILDHIRWSDNTIPSIISQCPALETLDLTSYGPHGVLPDWIRNHFETDIGGLPCLRKLFLQWYPPWRDDEKFKLGLDIEYPLSDEVEAERAVATNIRATSYGAPSVP